MSGRETMLRRLRGGTPQAPLPPPWAGAPGPAATARFVQRAGDAGAAVHLIEPAGLSTAVVHAVTGQPDRGVIVWDDSLLDECAQALREAGIRVLSGAVATVEAAAAAGFGLTAADYAIAETGTLVLGSGPGRPRAASLLPASHIAVLPEGRILGDLAAVTRELGPPLPSALTFITGPSRTADIGLTPVRPAHGPMTVTVFILAGRGPARWVSLG